MLKDSLESSVTVDEGEAEGGARLHNVLLGMPVFDKASRKIVTFPSLTHPELSVGQTITYKAVWFSFDVLCRCICLIHRSLRVSLPPAVCPPRRVPLCPLSCRYLMQPRSISPSSLPSAWFSRFFGPCISSRLTPFDKMFNKMMNKMFTHYGTHVGCLIWRRFLLVYFRGTEADCSTLS